ncbi:odorant receptor 85f [Drosophila bipectinata]|uniref:odorant receptor 85f n=1 Tax=Drosophila bipectinata TaxID=42026 RepID=UPI001C8AC235|nr:odorant receptor 85f [Drosophila bipectinata]
MQSVQYSYEDFAEMPSSLFRLMGYDMLETTRTRLQRIMMQLYRVLCLGSHCVCLGFMFFRLFEMKTIDSVSLVMRYATLVTYVVNSDTKYGTVLQRAAIQSLNNKLADLYPKTTLDRIYYRVNDHFWSRTLLYLIRFYVGSSIMVVVGPMLTSIWVYFFHEKFTYMHCYPYFIFNPEKHSVWIYVGIYALEWLHSTQMVISNIATDMWLIYFQVQICMHLRAMIKSIEDYQPRWENDVADRHFLSKIVDKHHYLVNLQTDLNSIFGSSLLLSLLSTASVLCTVSVYTLIQGLNLEGVTYVIFIGTSVVQMYLVCYHGQQVLDLSAYISHAVYNHNFHNASLSYKKFLLIIIIRSQKPVELNAMGYLPISLDTFKQLMSVIYRAITMLRQMIQ